MLSWDKAFGGKEMRVAGVHKTGMPRSVTYRDSEAMVIQFEVTKFKAIPFLTFVYLLVS